MTLKCDGTLCILLAGDVADVVLGFSELKPYLVRGDLLALKIAVSYIKARPKAFHFWAVA